MEIIYTQPDCLPASVTIFAIPKPFVGHIGLIQHNAIASWTKLNPRPEIFLYGDEQGTKDICQELELIHVPQIQRNEYGTPLLDGVFAQTCDRSNNKIIAYLNADIILKDDFLTAVSSCDRELDDYLLIGRRWDIDLNEKLDFEADWEAKLKRLIQEHGCLADYDCKDYFVFPKHLFAQIPKFAVGRGYWDTWMVTQTLSRNCPVVDCSLAITAIHQNHPYSHIRGGRNEAYMGKEAQINKALGKITQPGNIACATWQLKPIDYQNSPTISIIVVVEDDSTEIEKTVLSVLVQNYNDCEIVMVDCRNSVIGIDELRPYKEQIKYFSLSTMDRTNASMYGLSKASGELILYLKADDILLPKTLLQLIDRFIQEASTLDVLFAGYRAISMKQVTEYRPWNDFPDLEKLHSARLDIEECLLSKSVVVFRGARVKSLPNYLDFKCQIQIVLLSQISTRGWRASWFETLVENRYI